MISLKVGLSKKKTRPIPNRPTRGLFFAFGSGRFKTGGKFRFRGGLFGRAWFGFFGSVEPTKPSPYIYICIFFSQEPFSFQPNTNPNSLPFSLHTVALLPFSLPLLLPTLS